MGESILIETRRLLVVALVLPLLSMGCSSTSKSRASRQAAVDSTAPISSTAQARQPAEIRSMELAGEGDGASLELVADRPLVWTSFRDASGDLVIELPNSVPGARVDDLADSSGLVSSVDVELLDDADRPLTRLVVRTRKPSEHSLGGEDERLRLELLPVESGQGVALAYEPVPSEDQMARSAEARNDGADVPAASDTPTMSEPASEPAAMAAAQTPGAGGAAHVPVHGTPDSPQDGPAPTGVVASQLYAVDVASHGAGTVVQLAGDGQFEYSTFRLENPERFVIDLSGVVHTASKATTPVGGQLVDQIRIGQFKPSPDPVARVVFDLQTTAVPSIQHTSEGLTVTFGGAPPAAATPTTLAQDVGAQDDSSAWDDDTTAMADSGSMAEAPTADTAADSGSMAEPGMVDSGMADTGMVDSGMADSGMDQDVAADDMEVADVTSTSPPVDVYEPEPERVAAADTATVQPTYEPPPASTPPPPPAIGRPVGSSDVALFEAQEVQVEEPAEEEDPILASFGTLVVSRQKREYVGEPIDMSLKKADLVETLRSFATISDLNFVIQPGVTGSVTVELKGVPWDQAMEQILKINNLGMDIDGNIVRIAPMAQLRAEAEEQRRLAQARQQSVPLRTVMKTLSYSEANALSTLLRNRTGSILSNRGTVQVDARTNTLIIRELPENIDTVLAVIDNLDAPEPQVTIEARIIEATKSFSRSLGIQWGYNYAANQANGNTTGLSFPSNVDLEGGVALLTGGSTGLLNITLGNLLDTFTLDAQLQVAENEGLVNLVSAPRVTTLNNISAQIQSGLQIPIQTVSNNTVSVQFVNATLQLQVTPQVTAEGTIMMDINVAKRSPQPGLAIVGSTNAPISTREARTTVIVRDGGTAVIGGIYEVTSNQVQDRLPGLANIPILGHLFKNRNRSSSNDELMIFITPRIVQM